MLMYSRRASTLSHADRKSAAPSGFLSQAIRDAGDLIIVLNKMFDNNSITIIINSNTHNNSNVSLSSNNSNVNNNNNNNDTNISIM